MALEDFYEDVVSHLRPKSAVRKDTSGGPITGMPECDTVAEGIPCQVHEATAEQRSQYAMQNMVVDSLVTMGYSAFDQGDFMLIEDSGALGKVTGVRHQRARGSIPEHWVVMVEAVDDGQ